MKPALYIPLIAAGLGITAIAGFYLGKQGGDRSESSQANPPLQTEEPAQKTTGSATQTTEKRAVTPEVIAQSKNVPATLKDQQGDYTLVAVVEGADAIDRLQKSIRLIGAQRQRLATLSQQFNSAPADATELRKSIVGKINETKKTLEANLHFMVQNYAYSLNNSYMLVPHEASLLSITEVDGKVETKRVHAFKNAEKYEDFVQKLDVYLRLKLKQAKAAEAAKTEAPTAAVLIKEGSATPVPASDPAAAQDAKLKPTPEMDKKSKELQQLYKYNPEKNYRIRLEKTALYARAVRSGIPAKPASNRGKQGGDAPKSSQTNPPRTEAPVRTTTNKTTQTPQKRAITPEMIAKAKNVPAKISSPQGDFTLVSVVEGAESNRSLNQGLQIIGAQRKRLAVLSQQFEKIPADYLQQRELIAGQIHETKKSLEGNIRFMAQKYNYSVKNKYVQIPHQASLLFVTKVDGVAKAEKVYTLKNSAEYENFQKKRDLYLRLTVEQVKAAQAARKNTANLKPTPEMVVISKELKRLYKYDPVKNYKISLEKTALYARAAR